jgi:hypothetical protein
MNSARQSRFPWSPAVAHKHRLSRREAMIDTIITQLRLIEEGLDLDSFSNQFGQSLFGAFPEPDHCQPGSG